MTSTLDDPAVRSFLETGTRTGKLAYLSASGRPLVAPIWFILDGDDIVFNTGKDTAKGRSILRNPQVALVVDLEELPYAFVQVQGDATVSEDPEELIDIATRIAARYVEQDKAQEFGRRNGVPGELVVRVHPTKVIAALDVTA